MPESPKREKVLFDFGTKELEALTHEHTHVEDEILDTDFPHDELFYDLHAKRLLGERGEI